MVSLAHSVLRQSSAKSHSNSGQQIATVTDDRTENSFDKDIFLASPGETIKHRVEFDGYVRSFSRPFIKHFHSTFLRDQQMFRLFTSRSNIFIQHDAWIKTSIDTKMV